MKNNLTKGIVLGTILVIVLFGVVSVRAESDTQNPFHLIWNAINSLQEKIDNIQLIPGPQGPKGDQGEPGPNRFPTPDFQSNWITLPPRMAVIDVPHNVGGNVEDYFIEVTWMRHNGTLTSHQTAADKVWWEDVEPNNIQIITNGDVTNEFKAARVRIWRLK